MNRINAASAIWTFSDDQPSADAVVNLQDEGSTEPN
jgi:hypothetical protein